MTVIGWTGATAVNDFTDATLTFNPDANCLSTDDGDTSYMGWSGTNFPSTLPSGTFYHAYVRFDFPAVTTTSATQTIVWRSADALGGTQEVPGIYYWDLSTPATPGTGDLPYSLVAVSGPPASNRDGTYYTFTADVTSSSLLSVLAAGNLAATLHLAYQSSGGGGAVPACHVTQCALTVAGAPMLRHKNRDDGLGNSMKRLGPHGPTSQQLSIRRGPRAYQ